MLYSATIYEYCNTTYTLENTFVMLYALYDRNSLKQIVKGFLNFEVNSVKHIW